VGGGVQLGPVGTAATNRLIVPTPGDYDDGEIGGMMIGRGNRNTRRNPVPVPLCPPQTPHALSGRDGNPATNRFSYGMAFPSSYFPMQHSSPKNSTIYIFHTLTVSLNIPQRNIIMPLTQKFPFR
jgi:hypothetical protein